jgi:hypothetical protein
MYGGREVWARLDMLCDLSYSKYASWVGSAVPAGRQKTLQVSQSMNRTLGEKYHCQKAIF